MQGPIEYLPGAEPAPMGWQDVRRAISPLRMVFWGGLLCVFDLTFSEVHGREGFRFDILNDAVGMLLIAVGAFKLAGIRVHDRYAGTMTFIRIIAVLGVLDAVQEHVIAPRPQVVGFVLAVLALAMMVATVLFCVCMRWFCEEARLPDAARSWRTTAILFGVIYLVPLGLFYLAAAGAILTGSSFHINLGPFGLLLLPVFAVPIVHLFISTSRMKRAAEGAVPAPPPEAGWR